MLLVIFEVIPKGDKLNGRKSKLTCFKQLLRVKFYLKHLLSFYEY